MSRAILPVAFVAGSCLPAAAASPVRWSSASDSGAFSRSGISLIQAVSVAERQFHGRALQAAFHAEPSGNRFEVVLAGDHGLKKIAVDCRSDKVVSAAPLDPHALSSNEQQLIAAPAPSLSLRQAVAMADERGGNAVDGGLVRQSGKLAYRVDILHDRKLQPVSIAAAAPPHS